MQFVKTAREDYRINIDRSSRICKFNTGSSKKRREKIETLLLFSNFSIKAKRDYSEGRTAIELNLLESQRY